MASADVHETFWDGVQGAIESSPRDAFELLKSYMELVLARHDFADGSRYIDAALDLLRTVFGLDDANVQAMYEEHILCCNAVAMQSLSQGQSEDALRLLTTADQHTASDGPLYANVATRKRLRAITLNNFACYAKKHGQLHAAIQYLEKTLALESASSGAKAENPAGTHLNICAILSAMGRHLRAADHARCAVELLSHERGGRLEDKTTPDSLLAIAYFNYGAELEHQKKYDLAATTYAKGYDVARAELDSNHALVHALLQARTDAQDKVAARKGYSSPRGASAALVVSPRRK
ncbi:hypothetical protein SDRG_14955 [Saprolegnia diclina VS20]|uniref:MalT-like TPR region domain-containing protein n=1 Tax=Saprolegnia diclina (strain VS20) TaxID=1156394 RepID=T0PP70_SAPDV|nr:hypothetical protein SDRG_14955 [Saprolegnia diclina VS20]EQC27239.1 hypothetical protein SDRG_14955 [Saprolegnia diclina VS20]|eukprot:XP_008619338.1 hypothetical protein SDRG_14955 [Saprolegnia diclina VS20]